MGNTQRVIWAVVIAMVIAGAVVYGRSHLTGLVTTKGVYEGQEGYKWRFTTTMPGEDEVGATKTTVSLTAKNVVYPIGTFYGTCEGQTTDLLPNEKEKVVCAYISGGDEIGIFQENNKTVVKIGKLGVDGSRGGDFKVLTEI